MNKIKFKRLHPFFVIPTKATKYAACFDVVVTELVVKSPSKVYCKLGFSCELPKGYKLELVPRSSLTKTNWVLTNSPGQGDYDYRDEYQMRFTCIPSWVNYASSGYTHLSNTPVGEYELGYDDFPYEIGDRVGQVFLTKVEDVDWYEVEELNDPESNRDGGFGSTGN